MSESVAVRLTRLESQMGELNAKVDNFLGFEELSEDEKREVEEIRAEMAAGEFISLEDAFKDD